MSIGRGCLWWWYGNVACSRLPVSVFSEVSSLRGVSQLIDNINIINSQHNIMPQIRWINLIQNIKPNFRDTRIWCEKLNIVKIIPSHLKLCYQSSNNHYLNVRLYSVGVYLASKVLSPVSPVNFNAMLRWDDFQGFRKQSRKLFARTMSHHQCHSGIFYQSTVEVETTGLF